MTPDEERELATIKKRLGDYSREDPASQRRRLIEAWRKGHPEAAQEVSSALKPLVRVAEMQQGDKGEDLPDEYWTNDTYFVTLRRREDKVFRSGEMIQLGIASLDGTARHDWRDFQAIKNQLAGEDCEAFELYPSEKRLLDPSNYFTLWCFPRLNRIRVGHDIRKVRNADEALAPQRGFAKETEMRHGDDDA